MESIAQSAVAGLIAALVATTILGLAKYVRDSLAKSRDVKYIRGLLIEGRTRVMEAKDTYNKGMKAMLKEDDLRAAQYNNMITQISVALERWAVNLSHAQRKDIYDALDWYHTQGLHAIPKDGVAVFMDIPEGRWPTTDMSLDHAKNKFENLQSIKWLKLEAD